MHHSLNEFQFLVQILWHESRSFFLRLQADTRTRKSCSTLKKKVFTSVWFVQCSAIITCSFSLKNTLDTQQLAWMAEILGVHCEFKVESAHPGARDIWASIAGPKFVVSSLLVTTFCIHDHVMLNSVVTAPNSTSNYLSCWKMECLVMNF